LHDQVAPGLGSAVAQAVSLAVAEPFTCACAGLAAARATSASPKMDENASCSLRTRRGPELRRGAFPYVIW
jgi:hypothetical protein